MKVYRITWRHEVVVVAENDKQAKEAWENVDLDNLNMECHEFVEGVSFECVTDDYRDVIFKD